MAIFATSDSAHARARRIAASVNKTKSRSVYGAGYISDTIMRCPRHQLEYVLRRNDRMSPTLLMYECPQEGCLNTLQIPTKR